MTAPAAAAGALSTRCEAVTAAERWEPPGASPLGGGRWKVEIWAPHSRRVVLHLDDGRQVVLDPQPAPADGVGGYHCAEVDGLRDGDRYQLSLDGGPLLADPASRWQPDGVHGPSALYDPTVDRWDDASAAVDVPLERSVFYELHVGTFSPRRTFDGVAAQLDHLVDLGITTIELMPVAQFPGARNWGYDGVFPYAAQCTYGGPHGLARLVAACHRRGLAVALDVVYNHLGPEGNILPCFGPYLTDRYATPWGPAMNFDGWGSDEVRRYCVGNALWWFEQMHVDVLRLDAVHGIVDPTARPFLQELAEATASASARLGRRLLLVAESADNNPRLVTPRSGGGVGMDGQWSDDFHHALHGLLTGERRGYYRDFGSPDQLAGALDDGFVLRGQFSAFRGRRHGQPACGVAPSQLVIFDQNHDQVGNRPRGDRLAAMAPLAVVRLAAVLTLLAPGTPLVFMGEEYGAEMPFPYFVDHGDPELTEAVRRGRAREMADLWDTEPLDPGDPATFTAATVDLAQAREPGHREQLALYRQLLEIRRTHRALGPEATCTTTVDGSLLVVQRQLPPTADHAAAALVVLWNAGDQRATATFAPWSPQETITGAGAAAESAPRAHETSRAVPSRVDQPATAVHETAAAAAPGAGLASTTTTWRVLLGTAEHLTPTSADVGPWSFAVLEPA
ncbi:MAG: malto-oligosyltrehalose trehalohydrolase [Actinomycetota bacterium]|jgi:maltooligosyltrehalose trehalohydrolase|nr:malto-oligosyltrehalose trehalohydrolase [Actinomycetota bacterium]